MLTTISMSAEKTGGLPGLKGSRSQQSSPESSSSSSSSSSHHHSNHTGNLQLSRQASDSGLDQSFQQQQNRSQHRRGSSLDSQHQASLMSQEETLPVCTVTSPNYTSADLPELISTSPHSVSILHQSRPLILQHPHGHINSDEGINWLYDFYPSVLGGSPKDKLVSFPEQSVSQCDSTPNKVGFSSEPSPNTIFRSQEKYVVLLGAPISIAQRSNDDTLTYLNKGQFYNLYCKANTSMTVPEQVKTVIALTFFDEPDKRLEYNHWQYWYNLQANPNQRAFDIDRKNCENIQGKPEDIAYNATSFVWCPEVGAKLVLRINCLSTEFSSQKGVKGLPLHVVTDTYEDLDTEQAEPVHRAYCQVKVFRDKGAERKNKDETKSVERRLQKFMKQSTTGVDSEIGPTSVFHPPSKETVLTPTSTFGPKPFLFLAPLLESSSTNSDTALTNSETTLTPSKIASTSLLASIRERETKRTFSTTLSRAKDDLDNLEMDVPVRKAPRVYNKRVITLYARKEEEKVYNALRLDALSVHDLKLQVSKKYDIPADMIKNVFKKTKKGLLVHFDDEMISLFQDEDDFLIDLQFDNQNGYFDLYIRY